MKVLRQMLAKRRKSMGITAVRAMAIGPVVDQMDVYLQQTMNGKFQKEPSFANYWFCRGYTD